MNLSPEFISNIQNVFKEKGHAFLNALPDSIAEASEKWNLTDVQPAPTLSYNFVAFARRRGEVISSDTSPQNMTGLDNPSPTQDVVLKMGVPNPEMKSEMAALRLFNGEGACKLLDYDEARSWMLLERLNPGVMLSTLADDEEATHIAAEVMNKIWRPVESSGLPLEQERAPARQRFIQLTDWFNGLKKLRPMFNGGTGPLSEIIVQRVERSVSEFFAENHKPVLMHGDFHHFNILSSERGWLIIDPKGVIGPAAYEVGPFLMNPWADFLNGSNYRLMTKRRIDMLHEHLGFERERIHAWGLAHAVLSTWWGIEDNTGWDYSLAFAEMIADLQI